MLNRAKFRIKKALGLEFNMLERKLIEVENIQELRKLFDWDREAVLDDPRFDDFDYPEDLNMRRLHDAQVIESPFVPFSGELDPAIYHEHLSTRRYLLFFGTVGLLKGVKCLAEILEPLLSRHKDLFFVFVGKEGRYGGRPMLEYVRAQAGEHDDRVLHFDRMSHASLYPIIDHAEAVVLPSRIDNFPNACIEAMSRGKIIVGTRGASSINSSRMV